MKGPLHYSFLGSLYDHTVELLVCVVFDMLKYLHCYLIVGHLSREMMFVWAQEVDFSQWQLFQWESVIFFSGKVVFCLRRLREAGGA